MLRSSGASSKLEKKLLVLIAVKPPSTPGTAVPSSGVLTAAIPSDILVTRRLSDEHYAWRGYYRLRALPDTLLSINQVAQLFKAVYDIVHTTIREVEAVFKSGFHLLWTHLQEDADSLTQIDETTQKCSGFKGQTPPRERPSRGGDGEPGRSRWEGAAGDTMTLVGACRDTLRVIRAEHGANPDEVRQTLDEVEVLSGKIDELWHDGWRGYTLHVYNTEKVVPHSKEFVTHEGVYVNQFECLWLLVDPWLQKFRGLSKPGLEQSVRTYGFVRR